MQAIYFAVLLGLALGKAPPGGLLKYDLLSNSAAGINYPSFHLGAFVPQTWPAGQVNNELQVEWT